MKLKDIVKIFLNPDDRVESFPGAAKSSSLMAIWVGLFAAVGGFLYGYDTGLVNGLLEMHYVQQKFASNHVSFTVQETAIITAVLSLGTFIGALFAPVISDTWGRRSAIIVATALIFNVGTVVQVSASGIPALCAGRAINGLAVGIISAVVPLYQSEASPKWVRGAIVSTYQWAITWGLLVASAVSQGTHSLNSAASYRVPISLQFAWSCMLAIGMYMLPESPRFYVKKDKIREAAEALSVLRRLPTTDPGLIEELVEIKANHDYELSFGESSIIDCFRSGGGRHKQGLRMLTGISIQAFQQCTGINFIFYYGVNFFNKTGLDKSYLISFVTYAVNVGATIPGILLVELIGRRKLLLLGGVGMTISNIIIGIVGATTDSVIANKVMIGFVCTFIASFAASWGPVVWVVCGEIYSLQIRGKAAALTAATNWLVNFVFAYATPYLVDQGSHITALGTKIFFMWGGLNFLAIVFVYFTIYETKGLRLEEVDLLYANCASALDSTKYNSKVHLDFANTMNAMEGRVDSENKSLPQEDETIDLSTYNIGYNMNLVPMGNRSPPSLATLSTEEDDGTEDYDGDADNHSSDERHNYNYRDYISRLSSFGTDGTSPPTSEDSGTNVKKVALVGQSEAQPEPEPAPPSLGEADITEIPQESIIRNTIVPASENDPPEFDASDDTSVSS